MINDQKKILDNQVRWWGVGAFQKRKSINFQWNPEIRSGATMKISSFIFPVKFSITICKYKPNKPKVGQQIFLFL